MRFRLLVAASLLMGVSVLAGLGAFAGPARPNATCMLPAQVGCLDDSTCTPFGAICDVLAGACICSLLDLGVDAGGVTDAAVNDGSSMPTPSTPGGTGSLVGGGMSGPAKSSGCSFAPGRSR